MVVNVGLFLVVVERFALIYCQDQFHNGPSDRLKKCGTANCNRQNVEAPEVAGVGLEDSNKNIDKNKFQGTNLRMIGSLC